MSCAKLVFFVSFALYALARTVPAQADVPARLSTAIVANDVAPQPTEPAGHVTIAASATKDPITAELTFPLQTLPGDAVLQSCALRLVMSSAVPAGNGNGVLLEVLHLPDGSTEAAGRTVAAILVPPGTPENTAIILRSRDLCTQLPAHGTKTGSTVRYRLQTNTRNGNLAIWGLPPSARANPSVVPRMLLTYDLPDAVPGADDWPQIRRDAQRSGRSPWKLHDDPDGSYRPTQYRSLAVGKAGAGLKLRDDLWQSPLLHDGWIVAAQPDGDGGDRLVRVDRSGAVLTQVDLRAVPRYLAAGGDGRLFHVEENAILNFDIASFSTEPLTFATDDVALIAPPTVGADGSLYLVTDAELRAVAPDGSVLWTYPTGRVDVSTVTLSEDMKTAYVLFGGTEPRLLGLDSATGDCRLDQKLPEIDRGPKDPIPIPVAAGNDVLITKAFPAGNRLYIAHDDASPVVTNRGELIPPAGADCRTRRSQGALFTLEGAADDLIPTPVAGVSDDAFFTHGGQLCWWRRAQGIKAQPVCTVPKGCEREQMKGISRLVGDSSGLIPHLYGLDATSDRMFFLSVTGRGDDLAATCLMQGIEGLGPNLILGHDGTLYNIDDGDMLRAIVPAAFPASAKELTLTEELLSDNNDTAFRAAETIDTADDLNLSAKTDIILLAGKKITFGPGLRIAAGARLRARVGF